MFGKPLFGEGAKNNGKPLFGKPNPEQLSLKSTSLFGKKSENENPNSNATSQSALVSFFAKSKSPVTGNAESRELLPKRSPTESEPPLRTPVQAYGTPAEGEHSLKKLGRDTTPDTDQISPVKVVEESPSVLQHLFGWGRNDNSNGIKEKAFVGYLLGV